MSKPLPVLILEELQSRAATLAAREESPWHGAEPIVRRARPRESFHPAHGLVLITADALRPDTSMTAMAGRMAWSMEVTVAAFIQQAELPPAEGADTRSCEDELGLAAITEIIYAVNPEAQFGGQGFQQLCSRAIVSSCQYGENADGSAFGANVVFSFTFETDARDLRAHSYAPEAP